MAFRRSGKGINMPDLIKKFFDTFDIEPREFKSCDVGSFCPYEGQLCDDTCPYYKTYKVDYPSISDRILLELICILNENTTLDETYYQGASTVKELKKLVLKDLIKTKDNFDTIQQVQELFKGGVNA